MWIFAYTVIKAGTGIETHSQRVPTTPGGTYASATPVYTANSVQGMAMKGEADNSSTVQAAVHVESNMAGPEAGHAEIVKETGVPDGCKYLLPPLPVVLQKPITTIFDVCLTGTSRLQGETSSSLSMKKTGEPQATRKWSMGSS